MPDIDLARDHSTLADSFAARRYFSKFRAITGHLLRVAAAMQRDGAVDRSEVEVLRGYMQALAATFDALAMKYLMTGRDTGNVFGTLTFDAHESGFPVYRELLTMANDAAQATRHLDALPERGELLDRMVGQIVGELSIPTRLQFAMSQRLYYEALQRDALFLAQNDPQAVWQGNDGDERHNPRRRYLLHWAVYDSQVNLPSIYLMDVEDTGRRGLPLDAQRWPEVQAHLMAQSLDGLKLVTIAKGFDIDFDDLHPKRLRRFHVGPMYSSAYTRQSGPLHDVLDEADAPRGEDWALAWTLEELESERVTEERKGWFGTVEREIFALDPFSGRGVDTGATTVSRAIILPQRVFQVLAERNPPGFRDVQKFVVGPGGRVLSYR